MNQIGKLARRTVVMLLVMVLTVGMMPGMLVTRVEASNERVYLESDIFSIARSTQMRRHPLNGPFHMGGDAFFRGVSAAWAIVQSETITYNIEGRGFIRLQGVFGRWRDVGGALTVTGDGVLLAGYTIAATGVSIIPIDITIPPGTNRIVIRLDRGLGFGDAAFSNEISAQQPSHSLPPLGGAYLESDISYFSRGPQMRRHPFNGPIYMGGNAFFRGVSSAWTITQSETITYNIEGRNFTRLQGTFGSWRNETGTITISGDGAFLAGHSITASGASTIPVDVAIPPGTNRITIRLDRGMGFGDALFLNENYLHQSTPAPTPPSARPAIYSLALERTETSHSNPINITVQTSANVRYVSTYIEGGIVSRGEIYFISVYDGTIWWNVYAVPDASLPLGIHVIEVIVNTDETLAGASSVFIPIRIR